ncbi:MAG TPA: EamA/RhaT family transporter [Erysipelotrichaceae bacterium]|uniref:DMT family transporter n=1 Tax=Sharpea azabuensis TaxID=322505 RepID=UPI0008EF177C|nr:DMT family transporter [Sharpea azabuensis]SFE13876.1 Permease of the drug/metabolite transporter (DMT) superfamily [Sharpea azabuensis]SFL00711.1 Permease of the drug/metabolite transporter (DMT) superfamily [Sharpea azabuensis]HBZ88507.1 EamA/RhaT family transporter [Erysipelotrichaceae bacterium]HCJ36737.1 EamA/RhaT family transporter [Erysipelotrichaceae bacterium]
MNTRIKYNLLLVFAAMIWGSAFVAQKSGGTIGGFTYNGIRTLLGGLVLIPIYFLLRKNKEMKTSIMGGIFCGLALFIASNLQQFGINNTSASKAGFITSLYAIIVPFLSIFLHKKIRPIVWVSVVISLAGLYLLNYSAEGLSINIGDIQLMLCALAFAFQILIIDHYSDHVNGVLMSATQFIVAGLLSIVCMFLFEKPQINDILASWWPIVYAGVFSCAIAYTLQIVGQRYVPPTEASLIFCLESVFSLLAGTIFLHERMKAINYIGCLLIFIAVVLSQWPKKAER